MTKQQKYETALSQLRSLLDGETDPIACMANTAAALHDTFGFWWTGFYIVRPSQPAAGCEQELVLGPFQGPMACLRIRKGRGVCGTAWEQATTIIVADVHQFAGHIACSSESNSEIVVPLKTGDRVIAVLDIDSRQYDCFDQTDRHYLEQVAQLIADRIESSRE